MQVAAAEREVLERTAPRTDQMGDGTGRHETAEEADGRDEHPLAAWVLEVMKVVMGDPPAEVHCHIILRWQLVLRKLAAHNVRGAPQSRPVSGPPRRGGGRRSTSSSRSTAH